MKLYDAPQNPNSLKIRAVAHEVDVPLEIVTVNMQQGETKTPAYLAHNPNGKVPTLVDGDFSVWESNAIMCYVALKAGATSLLPSEPRPRATVEQWLFWQTAHLAPAVGKIVYERLYKRIFGLGEPDQKMIDIGQAEVQRFAGVLDTVLAKHDYVAGSLTVADFALAGSFVTRGPEGQTLPAPSPWLDVAAFTNVQAWLTRMTSRASWRQAL